MKQNNKKNCIIGIIGGIGTGKSEVSNLLKEQFGAILINSDKIGHEIILKGNVAYDEIIAYFGESIRSLNGEIDRKRLSDIVFHDEKALKNLMDITHPRIYEKIKMMLYEMNEKYSNRLIVLEAALLTEKPWIDLVDVIWYISCDLSARIDRLMNYRQLSREKIDAILLNQIDEKKYEAIADCVIDNSKNIENTLKQVIFEVNKLLEGQHEK